MTPELSIAIVLYNSGEELADCLRCIAPATRHGWAEVILVDNASPDDSVAIARRELPHATVVELGANRGFAAGANAALGRARGRYCLLLNPDVLVPEGGLEALVAWMQAHPQIALASPELIGTDGRWESPGRALPSAWRALLEATRLHKLLAAELRGRLLRGPYWQGGDQLDAGWVPGTAMILTREVMQRAGPLREDLFMYGEDIEWCRRIRRAGGRIGVCAAVQFRHASSAAALRSWGADEQQARMAAGIDAACRIMYGSWRARLVAAATALAMGGEALAPGRERGERRAARRRARLWLGLAGKRRMG